MREANRIANTPLFPRVHLNDTEKGEWSRSPLANDQFSDPSSPLSLSPIEIGRKKNLGLPSRHVASQLKCVEKVKATSLSVDESYITDDGFEGKLGKGTSMADAPKLNDSNFKNFCFKNLRCSDTDCCRRKDPTNTDLSLKLHHSGVKIPDVSSNRPPVPRNQESECSSQNSPKNIPLRKNPLPELSNKSPESPETLYPHEHVAADDSHEDVSDSTVMNSGSGWTASQSVVVRAMGTKQFWKLRSAMINQQKIFASQVFELHRLVSVQKRIARSPNLLIQGKCNSKKRGIKEKSLIPLEADEKPNRVEECHIDNVIPKLPLPLKSKEIVSEQCSSNTRPLSPWWLVPVMSPSEGLIYKPYTGPSPPTTAFMVPNNGKDSIDATFKCSHTYFQPNEHSWSSLSSRVSQAVPFSLRKSQTSKDSDVHGSTASSPPERLKINVLPLFPTEPTHPPKTETYERKEEAPLRAIKPIPHSANSTSESAARIFHCIQEERRHSDHMLC